MPTGRPSKAALLLALAHHWERLVRERVVRDYADIARLAGLTRARLSQITYLTLLAPEIQEALLNVSHSFESHRPINERSLRTIARMVGWENQRTAWGKLVRLKRPCQSRPILPSS